MKIGLASVLVDDQEKALRMYTEVLGFVKKADVSAGSGYRWLTVVSPEGPEGIELLLEPSGGHPAGKAYQEALFEAGIPATIFFTDDIHKEYERMKAAGVVFRMEPTKMDYGGIDAVFEDGCGNIISLHQA